MKLLILSISGAGAGHICVSRSLEKIAADEYPRLAVLHTDIVDYIGLPMKKTVIDSYALVTKRMPELWGFLYDTTNNPKVAPRFNRITKQLKRINSLRLYEHIKNYAPDAILCTHFLPADLVLNAPDKYQKNLPPVSIALTDYDIHTLWLVPGAHHFFVATAKMKWKIARRGWPEKNITVSGIPVDPDFYIDKPLAELKNKYRLPRDKKIILLLAGGHGFSQSDKIAETLFKLKKPALIIAIAGKNKKLENDLRELAPPRHISLCVVGWTDKMDEYLRLADLVVTKSGGVTTTECAVLGKPMVVVNPIPGQEESNAEFILENNLGRIARSPEDLLYFAEQPFAYKKMELKNAGKVILDQLTNI